MAKPRKPKPQKRKTHHNDTKRTRKKFANMANAPGQSNEQSQTTPVQPLTPKAPRHASTGTSYQSSGITDDMIQQPDLNQEVGSSQPVQIIEIVPELVSPYTRLRTYTYMMNDAGVDVSMRAVKTPVLGADFYLDPYDNLPINIEVANFIEDNLVDGMTSPFSNSLEDILHFFEDGYAVLEKVYEMREWTPPGQGRNTKNYTMLKKLGVRPPSTIGTISYDNNGEVTNIVQNAIRADKSSENVTIDAAKLLMFTFSRKGGDLTGRSLLRTAYPHWYYKTHFYKIDAIQKERHSLGVPKGILKPGYTAQDKAVLRNLLKNLRTNEEAFMLLVPNVDVEFAQIHGNLVDALDSAAHHNTMILLNVMAEFLAIGFRGSSGSRAAGAVQSDTYLKALRHVANYICDVVNMYLIPELVVWNYPTKNFPKLKARNIGETKDLQMLGAALSNLIAQEGITMDQPTEDWIRATFDMPKKQPDAPGQRVPTREQILAQGDIGSQGNSTNGQPSITPPDTTSSGNGKSQKGKVKITTGTGNVNKPASGPE